jgi:hypothetical protein
VQLQDYAVSGSAVTVSRVSYKVVSHLIHIYTEFYCKTELSNHFSINKENISVLHFSSMSIHISSFNSIINKENVEVLLCFSWSNFVD